MFNRIKANTHNSLFALFLSLSLITLPACSPHPVTGTWVASGDNQANYSKITIHFDPTLEIYSNTPEQPVQYCGWSAVGKLNIDIECMSSEDQKELDIYQFNIISEMKAELVREGKVVASFTQVVE